MRGHSAAEIFFHLRGAREHFLLMAIGVSGVNDRILSSRAPLRPLRLYVTECPILSCSPHGVVYRDGVVPCQR